MLTQVDVNNNATTYAYDEFGRATTFTGPYEQGSEHSDDPVRVSP